MPDSHDEFEYFCALEAAGQISSQERERLDEHLKTCVACQQALVDYEGCAEALTEQSDSYATSPIPGGMYQRFRARAQSQGIALPKEIDQTHETRIARFRLSRFALWSAAAAAAIIIFIFFIARHPSVSRQPQQSTAPSPAVTQQPTTELSLQQELQRLQEKQKEVTAHLQKAEQALRRTEAEKETLSSQIASLQKENDGARNREMQAEADVQRLTRQLEEAQAGKTAAQNNSALNAAQITELKTRIATVQLELSRERRLTATLQEMRDLMENRDVRVIQLGGVNRGKRVRAFGRAFYIPGEKLVLFAYDLSAPKALSAHSFYVWGDKPGADQPAQALGRLTLEDQKDDRWAIRIDSPDVFARINEIFITMESNQGNLQRPTGQPLLLTSLTKSNP